MARTAHINSKPQLSWYLSLLEFYFNGTKDIEKLMQAKNLDEVNTFMQKYNFPPFQPITEDMSFDQKRHLMKNVFLTLLKVYEKIEDTHHIDLSQFKNHALVLEHFEDLPQFLMQTIKEDFQKIKEQFSINLPDIPYENWPNG